MKKGISNLLLLLFFLSACNQQDTASEESEKVSTVSQEKRLTIADLNTRAIAEDSLLETPQPKNRQLIDDYRHFSNFVDSLYKSDPSKIELYIKLKGKELPIRVKNFDSLPDTLEKSYNIYRDTTGTIRYVLESPFNRSGDWLTTFVHYFDEKGETITFVRTSNFLHSDCTDGTAYEVSAYFFDQQQQLISKMYELKDQKGALLSPATCTFKYRKPYHIFQNLDELQKTILIK
ncbi:MAG: hypothetical protein V4714_11170 [Bacteroidota bacterium]